MGLFVGSTPVKSVYVGSTPVTAVYVGSQKVWPTWATTVQITLGTGNQARDQLRAALTARGLDYTTITEIPFDIELVGSGSTQYMFQGYWYLTTVPDLDTSGVTDMRSMFDGCSSLTSVPDLDTSGVTDMYGVFVGCSSLTSVPDLDTAQVTDVRYMFYGCAALTDGNVRLIGKHPNVNTGDMIRDSGLTREPFYTTDGQPWPTAEVHEVSLTDVLGSGVIHPLLTVTVPAGETWDVRIQGTMTQASGISSALPQVRIGDMIFGPYGQGEAVDCSGTVTSADNTIAILTRSGTSTRKVSFVGTVTIEK